ncbi:MAG TPA: hypothetical protein VGR73_06115 [Bryobacteraceae bacterium]|nr:hypothetical protein [Bryobacteraceae bacterium]
MGSETRGRSAKSAVTLHECPKCGAEALLASGLYGVREQVLFVLGASVYRCHSCEARCAHLSRWTLSLGDPTEDHAPYWVAAAITGGALAVAAIALWALRRNHRWPF